MPPALRTDFINAKFLLDFGTSTIEQIALAHFMKSGAFERHLRIASKALAERRKVLIQGLELVSKGRLEFFDSHAGAHLLVWLKNYSYAEGDAFMRYARERGLGIHSIRSCYLDPPQGAGFLMTYGALFVKEIRAAIQLFGDCLDASEASMKPGSSKVT